MRGRQGVYWPLPEDNGPVVGWPEGKEWIVVRAKPPCRYGKAEVLATAGSLRRP